MNPIAFISNLDNKLNTNIQLVMELAKSISQLTDRLNQIVANAPKAPAVEQPSKAIQKIVKKMSHDTFHTEVSSWINFGRKSGVDRVVLWTNGAVTSFHETDTKNPIAMFRNRPCAIYTLRKAGWIVPRSCDENGVSLGFKKFIVATRPR